MRTIKFTFRKPDHNQGHSYEHRYRDLETADRAEAMLLREGAKNLTHTIPPKDIFVSTAETL